MAFNQTSSNQASFNEMASHWYNPVSLLPLLLLVGAEVLHDATARHVGNFLFAPVAFSFGWITYVFSLVTAATGDGQLLPKANRKVQVVNSDNGSMRENYSWVLDRLVGDNEGKFQHITRPATLPKDSTGNVSLMVDIFEGKRFDGQGMKASGVFWMSFLVIIVQSIISAIPWMLHDNPSIFVVTILGSFLAIVTASLPQWAAEKWSSRRLSKKRAFFLTRGNGHQYVMMIVGHPGSFDLESMATYRPAYTLGTSWMLSVLATCWIALLITISGIKTDIWYLVAIVGLGFVQNTIAAALPCKPEELGMMLQPYKACPTITGYQRTPEAKRALKKKAFDELDLKKVDAQNDVRDVMGTLMELEKHFPKAGAALLPVFFPGGAVSYESTALTRWEKEVWGRMAEAQK